jgi:hypothetical protein
MRKRGKMAKQTRIDRRRRPQDLILNIKGNKKHPLKYQARAWLIPSRILPSCERIKNSNNCREKQDGISRDDTRVHDIATRDSFIMGVRRNVSRAE